MTQSKGNAAGGQENGERIGGDLIGGKDRIGGGDRPGIEEIKARLEEAQAELDKARAELDKERATGAENWDRFLRTRAEFENYQKRTQRDLAASIRRGKKDMLLRILDVADNLERALGAWRKEGEQAGEDPHLAGIEIIYRQLLSVLGTEGVAPIEAIGAEFDPALHDAVAAWEKEGLEHPTVTDEIQRGYTYEGEVLRPARVRVAKPAGS